MLLKVQNHTDLVRDSKTGAILNIDNSSLEAYKNRREKAKIVDDVIEQVNTMRRDVDEIKQLLHKLIENK